MGREGNSTTHHELILPCGLCKCTLSVNSQMTTQRTRVTTKKNPIYFQSIGATVNKALLLVDDFLVSFRAATRRNIAWGDLV